ALSLLAACGGTPASAPSAQPGAASAPASAAANTELQTIIDGARKEGQLSLVFGEGTMGGTEAINQLAVGFNKAYGLNLKIQFTPGVDMVAMAAKTVEEAQAKKQATSDLYVGYDTQINTISRADALEPVDWANWAPNLIKPGMVAPDGLAVTFESSLPGIVYNSQKFTGDAVPKTLQDLLQPRYKGQLASTPYASSFDRLSTPEVWGKDKTLDFATKYASQLAGLIRCNEMERIASGEFPIFAVSCSQNGGLSARAKGEPVDFEIAADYPMIMYLYLGVPRTSAHPNAAKLWVNYLLSRPAQDILYKYDFQDSHLVDGSQTATLIDKMQSQGVKFYLDNLEFYRSHDEKELQSVVAQVVKIFQSTH
ncbi:MAG TPA: ABC transporter substrate-binding protein, partial [Chloroflexota bacterium]|nr:ABC transporter substrate-binding protein [Chloroflexota bacterium]